MTFVDIEALQSDLGDDCESLLDSLPKQLEQILNSDHHGHVDEWNALLAELPDARASCLSLDQDCLSIGRSADISPADKDCLHVLLKKIRPWRKGPYRLFDINIDTEWRSDWKWQRLIPHIESLQDRKVLDVGCGSGYHCWRMRGAGASLVIGIDPMLRFLTQFSIMKHYIGNEPVHLLPLTMEMLPKGLCYFDTVFSLGVLYHRRSPFDHLFELRDALAPGGQLVMETLIIEENDQSVLVPRDRYAKMRNVWFITNTEVIISMLLRCGFINPRVVDITRTTTQEQKQTEWMNFESLETFLDPTDEKRTIEGYPAPLRAIFVAEKKS